MQAKLNKGWPVLTHYDQDHLARVALPLGGIGTGTVALGGRGNLQDWEIMNRPAKGFLGGEAFFTLYAKAGEQPAVTRLLEGVLQPPYEGSHGATAPYHGMPRFRHCAFHAAYPFAQVVLSDPDVPVDVRLEAFNPLVPADADTSGIPVAILRYVVQNKTEKQVSVSVCGSIKNFVGMDGEQGAPGGNINTYRQQDEIRGLFLTSNGVPDDSEQFGTIALATTAPTGTHQCSWSDAKRAWHTDLLGFWDDLSEDGQLDARECVPQDAPMGSLAAEMVIPPHGEGAVTFLLTWHFPNRQTWTPAEKACCGSESPCCSKASADTIGNYYTTQYQDAWDVAVQVAARLPDLEAQTLKFVNAFCQSDLPDVVKEAALYNLSTLRTQTCFRTRDGRFYGWEGCSDDRGCCLGSCTHVWNYEQATAFTFGELARSMREVEFLYATNEVGHMSFRVHLPLERAQDYGLAAADGQMGCILKVYRDWQLCGDDEWLEKLWPKIKRALEFCWIPGGWDADRDGVMEGCQHNTLDVEYFGPNPLMGAWYLGALRAGEEMAGYLGDGDFASKCRDLFEKGSRWIDANLFNGEYYEQRIVPPGEGQLIAEGLRHRMGAEILSDPDFQVGPGCLVDQLAGQFVAQVCGLGYLLDPQQVHKTLDSIMKYNFQTDLHGHFNPMRTFALNDEQALLMCSFPRGGRPKKPVPYYAEVMTGFEYTASVHMLYEGQIENGLRVISAIRARYDGRRRNPFDEAECGHHYARAMASWAAILALTGFHYSAVEQSMTFADKPGRHFWSNGYAWGTCEIQVDGETRNVKLSVLHGSLKLKRFMLSEYGQVDFGPRTIQQSDTLCLRVNS